MTIYSNAIDYVWLSDAIMRSDRIAPITAIIVHTSENKIHQPILAFHKNNVSQFFGEVIANRISYFFDQTNESCVIIGSLKTKESYEKSLEIISDLNVQWLMLLDVFFDQDAEFYHLAIDFSIDQLEKGQLVLVCGQVTSLIEPNWNEIDQNIKQLSFPMQQAMDHRGKHLIICANQYQDQHAAIVFVAQVKSLGAGINPVNKKITANLNITYDAILQKKLIQMGVCFARTSIAKGNVIAFASCAVQDEQLGSRNVANVTLLQSVVNELTLIQNQYIGNYSVLQAYDEITLRIRQLLYGYQLEEKLKYFYFNLTPNEATGTIAIAIDIVPFFSIEKITHFMQLRVIP